MGWRGARRGGRGVAGGRGWLAHASRASRPPPRPHSARRPPSAGQEASRHRDPEAAARSPAGSTDGKEKQSKRACLDVDVDEDVVLPGGGGQARATEVSARSAGGEEQGVRMQTYDVGPLAARAVRTLALGPVLDLAGGRPLGLPDALARVLVDGRVEPAWSMRGVNWVSVRGRKADGDMGRVGRTRRMRRHLAGLGRARDGGRRQCRTTHEGVSSRAPSSPLAACGSRAAASPGPA